GGIQSSLVHCGKGWYNLEESNRVVYDVSKLKRLLSRVNMTMQDTLRFLVEDSVNAFVHMLCDTRWNVSIKAPDSVHNSVVGAPEETDPDCIVMASGPVFGISLIVEDVAPTESDKEVLNDLVLEYPEADNGEDSDNEDDGDAAPESDAVPDMPASVPSCVYKTDPTAFVQGVIDMFDQSIQSVTGIPQIEPSLLPNLLFAYKPNISSPMTGVDWLVSAKNLITDRVNAALLPLKTYMDAFNRHRPFLYLDTERWAAQVRLRAKRAFGQEESNRNGPNDGPLTSSELRALFEEHIRLSRSVLDKIPERVHVGMFVVRTSGVRKYMAAKHVRMAELVRGIIEEMAEERAHKVSDGFGQVVLRLRHRNTDIEEVVATEQYIEKLPAMQEELNSTIDVMLEYYTALDELNIPQSDSAVNLRWKARAFPLTVKGLVEDTLADLSQERGKFEDEQRQEQVDFGHSVDMIARQVTSFASRHTSLKGLDATADEAQKISRDLRRMEESAKRFNSREAHFGLELTDYGNLSRLVKDFEPQTLFWQTAQAYTNNEKTWMEGAFDAVNATEVEQQVDDYYRNVSKALRSFKNQPQTRDIAEGVRDSIAQFKKYVPLLLAMRNEGMKERHWLSVSELLKFDLRPDLEPCLSEDEPGYIFKTAVDMGLWQHASLVHIQTVSDVASKEYNIQHALESMRSTWQTINLTLAEYGETGTYVLKGSDDIIQLLDDHTVTTQAMSFSAFKKPFEEQINSWEATLSLMGEVMEEWLLVQQSWLYLEPIFSSDDIMRQLPTEGKNFRTVDHTWRRFMSQAHTNPSALSFLQTDKLLAKLQEANILLDGVQKGLKDYLETKRQAFPRFYFLSDDELLEILSQTRDPTAVQPFFRSCFENIKEVVFQGADNEMVAMLSQEGERVDFFDNMYPAGNVEDWMLKLESTMVSTVRNRVREGFEDYVQNDHAARAKWVRRHSAQTILAVSQIFFAK
ncbi:dynein heavy chain 1, axonemal, partial [Kipferlia bialata]